MINLLRKNLFKIITGLLCLLLFTLILIIIYGFYKNNSIPKEFKPLAELVTKTNEHNKDLYKYIYDEHNKKANKTLDLSNKISELTTIKDELETIKLDNKYNSLLKEGLKQNLLFFRQLQALNGNIKGKDVAQSMEALYKYKIETVNNYSNINIGKLNLKESVSYLNELYSIMNERIKQERDADINTSQIKDYINEAQVILSRFTPITEDMTPFIERCRSGEYAFEIVLNDIDKNSLLCTELKKELLTLTVPNKTLQSHDAFKEVFTIYELYLKDLRIAVNNERIKSLESKLESSAVINIYENSIGRYEDLMDSLQRLENSLEELKKQVTL